MEYKFINPEKSINFLNEFKHLLKKYGVWFSSDDHWVGYPECGQNIRIEIYFNDYETSSIDFGDIITIEKIDKLIKEIKED